MACAGWIRITLARPRDEVVLTPLDGCAHGLDADFLARLGFGLAGLAPASPSAPSSAGAQPSGSRNASGISRWKSGCMCAAIRRQLAQWPQGAMPAGRRPRTASRWPAPGRVRTGRRRPGRAAAARVPARPGLAQAAPASHGSRLGVSLMRRARCCTAAMHLRPHRVAWRAASMRAKRCGSAAQRCGIAGVHAGEEGLVLALEAVGRACRGAALGGHAPAPGRTTASGRAAGPAAPSLRVGPARARSKPRPPPW